MKLPRKPVWHRSIRAKLGYKRRREFVARALLVFGGGKDREEEHARCAQLGNGPCSIMPLSGLCRRCGNAAVS